MTTSQNPPASVLTISEDGLTLTLTTHLPEGDLVQTMRWEDLATAKEHYDSALRGFEERAADPEGRSKDARSKQYPTPVGIFAFVTVNGGERHRLPRAKVSVRAGGRWRLQVGFAWLRRVSLVELRPKGPRA